MPNLVKQQKNSFVFKLMAVFGCLGLLLAGSGWLLAPPAAARISAAAQATVTPGNAAGLANSRWQLVSFGPPGAETPVLEGSTITLEFEAGTQAGGSGGCNSYGGQYQVQDGTLLFSDIVSTLMACADEQVTQQEQRYLQALGSAGQFELAADRLTIWYGDGQGVLNFVRATTPPDESGPAQPTPEQADNAGTPAPGEALQRLFTGESLDESWFTEPFLAQVPLPQVESILAQLGQQLGDFERIEGEASPFIVVFTGGQATAETVLDAGGRIAGLHFQALTPRVGSLEEAVALFQQLPGQASLLVLQDGEELAALNAGEPLAVGSGFKLAVLAALQEQIEAGEHTWDEVVTLQPEWKSLPYSLLKDWPDGSPLTLHTLATLMISLSDNTAADALIHILGRESVEAHTPGGQPLLTTLEASKLKARENAQLRESYLNASEAEKRQIIATLNDLPVPDVQNIPTEPTLDWGWHFATRDLCRLMAQVEALDLMAVEPGPGVANPDRWARVAYKGGSEIGVLNLTTWLEGENGTGYCVSATLNRPDAAIDQETFFSFYRALVETLP